MEATARTALHLKALRTSANRSPTLTGTTGQRIEDLPPRGNQTYTSSWIELEARLDTCADSNETYVAENTNKVDKWGVPVPWLKHTRN